MGDGFLPKVWVETDVASDRTFAPTRAARQNRLVEEEDVVVVVSAMPRSNSLPSLRRDRAREFIARTVRSIDPCVKDARGATTTFDVRKRHNGRKLVVIQGNRFVPSRCSLTPRRQRCFEINTASLTRRRRDLSLHTRRDCLFVDSHDFARSHKSTVGVRVGASPSFAFLNCENTTGTGIS